MSNIRQSLEHAYKDNLAEMRDSLHAALTEKIIAALEEKKNAIAKGLLKQESTEELEG